MDYSKSYTKARSFFDKKFSSERKQVIKDLEALNYDVIQEEKNGKIGSSVYSGLGILGFSLIAAGVLAAPITGGVSTSMVWAGLACEGASGGAAVLHQGIKKSIVQSKNDSLRKKLREHEKTCKEMNQHLSEMVDKMENKEKEYFYHTDSDQKMNYLLRQFEVLIEHSDTMKKFKSKNGATCIYVLMSLQHLLKDVPFEEPKDEDKFAAVTFVIDLKSLLDDPKSKADLKRSGECKEEWLIEKVRQRYQEEHDDIGKVFKSPSVD